MVEENKKEPEKEKVNERPVDETNGEAESEAVVKVSLIGRFKKYLIPVGSAVVSFAVAAVLFTFVLDREPKLDNEIVSDVPVAVESAADNTIPTETDPAETHPQTDKKAQKEKTDTAETAETKEFTKEDVARMEIDTTEIMRELDFLFVTPETDEAGLGLNPQDSVDTLSWIEKEMADLTVEKNAIAMQRKELEAMQYKIDQGLIKIEQAESSRMIKLARLYDGMKANEVTKLFANLSDEMIVSILPRMKAANASKILGLMPPKRAARLSTEMVSVLED